MENKHSFFIAITGCIGSGKTTVANYLIENGYQVIMGDALSRQCLNCPEVVQNIQDIVHSKDDGKLDLKYIGSYFDKNPDDEIRFEQWFQPFLGRQIRSQIKKSNVGFVFWDMPYLKQKSVEDLFDVVWVMKTDSEVCKRRVRKRNHYANSKINFMLAFSSAEYPSDNTIEMDNNSDKQALFFQIHKALQQTFFSYYAKQICCFTSPWYPNLICCPDIVAGRNGAFWFGKRERYLHKHDTLISNEDVATIVIVLESPHKSEFNLKNDDLNMDVNPALGKTGSNLQKYFTDAYLRLIIADLPSKYRVILMNSIQYQCSLGTSPPKYRDHIWLNLWFGSRGVFQDSFVTRLHSYHPDYIFNLCTIGDHSDEVLRNNLRAKTVINHKYIEYCLRDSFFETDSIPEMDTYTIRSMVTASIKEELARQHHAKKIVLFEGNHPSGWRKNPFTNVLIRTINNAK